ncbi:OmpA family protein [Alcanivorax sediminis]|nr:OmpA family protein [Alcanivorax sediminis]
MGGDFASKRLVVLMAGVFFVGTAESQSYSSSPEKSFYVGYRAGISFLNIELDDAEYQSKKNSEFSQGLLAGYQFSSPWAAEFFWHDLGDAEVVGLPDRGTRGMVELETYGLGTTYSIGYRPNLDFGLSAGLAETSYSYRYYVDMDDENEQDVYLGASMHWLPYKTLHVRANYTFINNDIQFMTLGIVKYFQFGNEPTHPNDESDPVVPLSDNHQCEDFEIYFDGIQFAKASVALNEESRERLEDLASQLKELPDDIHVEIRAQADRDGSETYNYSLSIVRARAVRDYLAKQGFSLSRITADGYGEWGLTSYYDPVDTESELRRADIVLVGLERYLNNPQACGDLVRRYSKSHPG